MLEATKLLDAFQNHFTRISQRVLALTDTIYLHIFRCLLPHAKPQSGRPLTSRQSAAVGLLYRSDGEVLRSPGLHRLAGHTTLTSRAARILTTMSDLQRFLRYPRYYFMLAYILLTVYSALS